MSLTVLTAILMAAAAQANSAKAKTAVECCEAKQAVRACAVKCEDVAACCDTPEACVCVVSCEKAAECCSSKAGTPTVLSFTAKWCGPCREMSPVIEKLQKDGFAIKHIDIDQHPELAKKYRVESIPAFVATLNGHEVARAVGKTDENVLVRLFRRPESKPARSASQPPMNRMQFHVAVPPHAGLHPVAMHAAPGATDVQMLVRATYELPPCKAKALMTFLEETVNVEVETKLDGDRLIVTTSPEAQRTIGQFISVLMPKPAGQETVSVEGTGKSTCDSCPLQKKGFSIHVKHTAKKAGPGETCTGKSACGKETASDDNGEACREGHSTEAVRITIPMLGPVFAPPLPPTAFHGPHAPWNGAVMIYPPHFGHGPENRGPEFRMPPHAAALHVHAIPEGLDPETIARWHARMAQARKHLQYQLGLDCEEVDCPKAPAAEESISDE